MHDCLNDQPARTVCKVAQSEIYACLADARARAARLIQPARRAPLNAGIKSFPTRDRRPSETEIQIAQKSQTCIPKKWARGPVGVAYGNMHLGDSVWYYAPRDFGCKYEGIAVLCT